MAVRCRQFTVGMGGSLVAGAAARVGDTLARVLRTIGYAIVAVLVLHIVLTLLQANPANAVAALIARLAGDVRPGHVEPLPSPATRCSPCCSTTVPPRWPGC